MRLINVDALVEQIEIDSKGNEGQYGDEWRFMDTIQNAPTIELVKGWIPCDKFQPDRDGTYLVTTANGAIRFDKFVDGTWCLCTPRARTGGKYRPHRAWMYLPRPYEVK